MCRNFSRSCKNWSCLLSIPLFLIVIIFLAYPTLKEMGSPDRFRTVQQRKPTREKTKEVVHIDLKGSPPKIDYLIKFLSKLSKIGVTGVMVEYDDMFPYEGFIRNISARSAYNKTEINGIVNFCKSKNIELIPMIQTFGEMEHVLKLKEFRGLRETQYDWSSICPKAPSSTKVIREMINQIMKMHQFSKRIHIGCGEVQSIQKCVRCAADESRHKEDIFFDHVRNVIGLVRKHREVKPLIWDHMLRSLPLKYLIETKLTDQVEIVVQDVAETKNGNIELQRVRLLEKYTQAFKTIWMACPFRGFESIYHDPPSMFPSIQDQTESWKDYIQKIIDRERDRDPDSIKAAILTWIIQASENISNWYTGSKYHDPPPEPSNIEIQIKQQNTWLNLIQEYIGLYPDSFVGYMLTGNSKTDHFAESVDLLPASIHSLLHRHLRIKSESPPNYNEILNCSFSTDLSRHTIYDPQFLVKRCSFDESKLMSLLLKLDGLRFRISKLYTDLYEDNNWFSPYHLENDFYNSLILKNSFTSNNFHDILDFFETHDHILKEMENYFTRNVIEEWRLQHMELYRKKILALNGLLKKISATKNYDRKD